jgi:HPt (histidine-containing phosphotransfer) domain-containing protein
VDRSRGDGQVSGTSITVEVDTDLEDLIPGFLQNRRDDVQSIQESLAADDLERIRVIGHSMKGAGGGYGFDGLTDIGADIESAALAGDVEQIRSSVQELTDYLDRVNIVFV